MSSARSVVNHTQLAEYLSACEQSDVQSAPEALSAAPQLRAVQQLLLVLLADYWLVKYTVHREARRRIGTTVDALRPFGIEESSTMGDEEGDNGGVTLKTTDTSKCVEERRELAPNVDDTLERGQTFEVDGDIQELFDAPRGE